MQGFLPPRLRASYLAVGLLAGVLAVPPAQAQVSVRKQRGEIEVRIPGFKPQRAQRHAGKADGSGWVLRDEGESTYEACAPCHQNGDGTVTCGGVYQGPGVDPRLVKGYPLVLDYLVANHGAVVTHDDLLDVEQISFPNQPDPIDYFFTVIITEKLNGYFLYEYFRFVEINSMGSFDPAYQAAKPGDRQYAFPDDPFYSLQWNLTWTRLAQAQWHPVKAKKRVLIGVIDSGIGPGDTRHPGLDGTAVAHWPVAPTSGFPAPHALNIITLLGDEANDGDGVIGLLGDDWDSYIGYRNPPLLSRKPPEIRSYNVGDFGPISLYVARAIWWAIYDGVDVINLSVALPPSPIVEEAIRAALKRKIIVVAAAGNYDPSVRDKPAKFPANVDGVISVGAAGRDRRFSPFSANRGVHILAPGEDIIMGQTGNIWSEGYGTSYAAPHVVAALAMMKAVDPSLKPADALEALQARAQNKDGRGVGFLSALSSLNHVLPRNQRVEEDDIPLPHEFSNRRGGGWDDDDDDRGWGWGWKHADGYDPSVDVDLFATEAAAGAPVPEGVPGEIALLGNYPNPFNPATLVRFTLPEGQHVRLAVYNVLGQEVQVLADAYFEAGTHDVGFVARDLASGVYVARLDAEGTARFLNMVLMK